MTTTALNTTSRPSDWITGALLGVGAGAAATLSVPFAVGAIVVALMLYLFVRSSVRAEILVAAYWVSFCLYETLFASAYIGGFFYPFYAAFAVSILVILARSGVDLARPVTWLYGGLLVVVLGSFVGFAEPTSFEVVQRVFAYLFAGLIALQIGSRKGLVPVTGAALIAGVVIAGWVVISAVQGGFTYRGDVGVDQNAVTFYLGFGLVAAFGIALDRFTSRNHRGTFLLALVAVGLMVYATVLLASRGITIALVMALVAMTIQAGLQNWRVLAAVAVMVALGAATLLLPGGGNLLERFEDDTVQTGNNRLPIWEATLDSYAQGDARRILLGAGFDSSKFIVQQSFGSLTSTHNAFVQVLYEFGLVGLALFVALHVYLLVRAWAIRNRYGLTMVGIVWFLIGSNLVVNASDGFMYWTALGFAVAIGMWGNVPDERHRVDADRG